MDEAQRCRNNVILTTTVAPPTAHGALNDGCMIHCNVKGEGNGFPSSCDRDLTATSPHLHSPQQQGASACCICTCVHCRVPKSDAGTCTSTAHPHSATASNARCRSRRTLSNQVVAASSTESFHFLWHLLGTAAYDRQRGAHLWYGQ
jgi:hypothetical protein